MEKEIRGEAKIKHGKKISKWGKNVFVKVPYSNTKGKFSGKVIKALNSKKIKLLKSKYKLKINISSSEQPNQPSKEAVKPLSNIKNIIATARAGNVLGGGDYAENRLVPDILKALKNL